MMFKIFKEDICDKLDVYMDDMIVKSTEEGLHNEHLESMIW